MYDISDAENFLSYNMESQGQSSKSFKSLISMMYTDIFIIKKDMKNYDIYK